MSGMLAGLRARRMNEAAGARQNIARTVVAADALLTADAIDSDRESAAVQRAMLEKRATESTRLQRRIATSETPAELTANRPENMNVQSFGALLRDELELEQDRNPDATRLAIETKRARENYSLQLSNSASGKPAASTTARPKQRNVRYSESPNNLRFVPNSVTTESDEEDAEESSEAMGGRPTRYPSWEEQRKSGQTGNVTVQGSGTAQHDPNASDLSFTSKLLIYMLGGIDDLTDFFDFFLPGVTTLISGPFVIGQIIIIALDKNTRKLPPKEKIILLAKRIGVIVIVAVIESIPIIAVFPLQSFLVAFLLSRIKNKIKNA
ncbi:MAG: hypothetical protein WCL23_00820 [Candidatus Moraniibacteriota bacterium]